MIISKKIAAIAISAVIVSTGVIVPTTLVHLNQNCNTNPIIDNPIDPNNETELIPFTESKVISGINFTFENFLWRDFMPCFPSDPGGTDLMAVIYLKAINTTAFPSEDFTSERMWVFYQNETWEADLEIQEIGYLTANSICLRADGGPKWETMSYVNITLEIIHQGCTKCYISAFNQRIWRTE